MPIYSTITAIPNMTSNTSPSGVASASSVASSGNYSIWSAFSDSGSGWETNSTLTGWIAYEFPSQKLIYRYSIGQTSRTYNPISWFFEGTNDDINWTQLDSQTNASPWPSNAGLNFREFDISNPQYFKKYRLRVTQGTPNGGLNYLIIRKLEMYELIYSNKFLISSEGESLSILYGRKSSDTSIPIMTSDTAPSGRAFAGTVYSTNYPPWKAFNGIDDVEGYVSAIGSAGIGSLGYEFPYAISLYKYLVRSSGTSHLNKMPKNWTFEGSNDGSNWTILDTQVNQTWTTQYTDKEYYLNTSSHYKKFKMYRLNWTANNGFENYTDVNELKMFEIIVPKYVKVPSLSESNFNKYGISKDVDIDLRNSIISISEINNSAELLGLGKVFKQKIDRSKHRAKKIILG
ncbi:hypothetical protein [Paenibacillus taichungensis]